jgi:CO/xanthine dehydrogenase Mo-binding subunit
VDPETGEVRLLRYGVAHDCGTLINPLVVAGQIHGGVAQGLGGALYERLAYDAAGQLVNTSFLDFLLPTADQLPPIALAHRETPSPLNPLGIKGLGEAGAIPGPALIASALDDALRPLGVHVTRLPLTPAELAALIAAARVPSP